MDVVKEATKVVYNLYDNGSCDGQVICDFLSGFKGMLQMNAYNVYKLFDRKDSTITRYACMAHLRRKFVESLQTDSRSAEIMNLISEFYWIERDCRIHFLSEDARREERRRRSVPLLGEIWQKIKPIFDETCGHASNLFIKAIRYAVNEWEAVCRYVRNGKAEIDNNTAERMMKPICLGRYLFCGSESAAKNTFLIYSIIETCKMNGL